MLSGGIALQDAAPFKWPDDALTLVRALRQVLTELNSQHVLGMPADRLLHFVVAGMIFLVVSRWAGRKWAFLASLFLIVIKEVVDIPRNAGSPHRPYPVADAIGDALSGLLGVAAAYLIVSWRGDRWRRHGLGESARPLRQPLAFEFSGRAARTFAAASLVVIVATAVALELGSRFNWVHLAGAALVCVLAWRLGVGTTLIILLPLVPFVNWADYWKIAPHAENARFHPLAVSDPLLLGLACFSLAQIVHSPTRTRRLSVTDLLVLLFAVLATVTVTVSTFALGPLTDRFRWVVAAIDLAAVYFLVTRHLVTKRRLVLASASLALGLVAMSVIGIVEFITQPVKLQLVPKVTYTSAELFSIYLAMAVPFAAGLAVLGRGWLRWLGGAAGVLGLICVGLVFSRTCWVSAAISLPMVGLIWAARKDKVLGLAAVFAIALALFFGYRTLVTAGIESGQSGRPVRSSFLSEVTSIAKPDGFQKARAGTITNSFARIAGHPIIGSPGNWVDSYYLTLVVTYGLPLAAVLLLALLLLFGQGVFVGWRIRDPALFAIVGSALAGLIGAAVEGMAESGCARPGFIPLFWFLLAAIPAAMAVERSRQPAPAESVRAPALARIHADVPEPRKYVLLFIFFVCVAVVCVVLYYILR